MRYTNEDHAKHSKKKQKQQTTHIQIIKNKRYHRTPSRKGASGGLRWIQAVTFVRLPAFGKCDMSILLEGCQIIDPKDDLCVSAALMNSNKPKYLHD